MLSNMPIVLLLLPLPPPPLFSLSRTYTLFTHSFIQREPQLKFSRGNMTNKFVCMFALSCRFSDYCSERHFGYGSRLAFMLCYKVDLLACSLANSRNIYYFNGWILFFCFCVFFSPFFNDVRTKRCVRFGLAWFGSGFLVFVCVWIYCVRFQSTLLLIWIIHWTLVAMRIFCCLASLFTRV